jgi:hypothetical protein
MERVISQSWAAVYWILKYILNVDVQYSEYVK